MPFAPIPRTPKENHHEPNTAIECRNLLFNVLTESPTNPRLVFEDVALRELAESIQV